MGLRKKKKIPTVSFATIVWEKDWKYVLLDPGYLPTLQIKNNCFDFLEKILIINNVNNLDEVRDAAQHWVQKGVLTKVIVAQEIEKEMTSFFQVQRQDFKIGEDARFYENVNCDWLYYNALGPLSAIYSAKGDYLLYLTGDVRLDQKVDWIEPSLEMMENHSKLKVANLVWNGKMGEAKRESYRRTRDFFIAKQGFSDQMFLVSQKTFRQPIYGEIREDASHYPRGDVFEKRVFSYLKNRGFERIIYRHGSYTHENF